MATNTHTYPRFAAALKKVIAGQKSTDVAAASGISGTKLDEALAGTYLPTLEEIHALAKHFNVKPAKLSEAGLEDLANIKGDKQEKPRPPVRQSPSKARNRW